MSAPEISIPVEVVDAAIKGWFSTLPESWDQQEHFRIRMRAALAAAGYTAAPAAGDARDDLTLNQKYEDACILANANARDAGRYRVVRKSIVDEANGSNQVAAASEAIGLERGAYPTPDQFDAIVDHIAAQQGKVGEA
ncbi:hypothetical protein LMG26858_04398 [Achromobacter anxifer]|uniref:Uncharacterized protein n=1 Tax=Achromobacter anxifer TaxID=1287737 RepID=A0A6S7ECM5_9BURK|nr:hypothetical protein [Achromobacter anxifer]CAB3904293.1 hypothetical protein LMG26858_04398 [Achromobacter anxifer]